MNDQELIEESKDLEKLRVEEQQNSLKAHEQRALERSGDWWESSCSGFWRHKPLKEMMVVQ